MNIDSKNKKILIFSDPHQHIDVVTKILREEEADYNVCLGDWFDSHILDSEYDARKTALFVKAWTRDPKNITLFGNHDTSYLFNSKYTKCSGYTESKDNLITDVFGDEYHDVRNRFRWFIYIDDYLCTHAGIHPNYIPPFLKIENKWGIIQWLNNESKAANIAFTTSQNHWFAYIGRSRYGSAPKGGLTWLDFEDEFEPIEGITQIVGHTPTKNPCIRKHHTNGNLDFNEGDLCIDNFLGSWLTITNGKLEVKYLKDL